MPERFGGSATATRRRLRARLSRALVEALLRRSVEGVAAASGVLLAYKLAVCGSTDIGVIARRSSRAARRRWDGRRSAHAAAWPGEQLAFLGVGVVVETSAAAVAGTHPFAVVAVGNIGVVVGVAASRRNRRRRRRNERREPCASQSRERAIGKSRQMILERRVAPDRLRAPPMLGGSSAGIDRDRLRDRLHIRSPAAGSPAR